MNKTLKQNGVREQQPDLPFPQVDSFQITVEFESLITILQSLRELLQLQISCCPVSIYDWIVGKFCQCRRVSLSVV